MRALSRATIVAMLVAYVSSAAWADKSGTRANVIDLPTGPGSISGLGEQFEPNLNTGSATYGVKLQVPPGTAGFAPSLSLHYDSGQGDGPTGIGWTLDVGALSDRRTTGYLSTAHWRFLYNGQELVPEGQVSFQPTHENKNTAYPSFGIYSYTKRDDGKVSSKTLYEFKEQNIDALNGPPTINIPSGK